MKTHKRAAECKAILASRSERDDNQQSKTVQVIMASDEFGGEEFKFDTLKDAYEGVARLAAEAAKLNDGIHRDFYVRGDV